MKRSRFDADYERVRRKPPPAAEFPEAGDTDLFERERAARIAASNSDFQERMAALATYERQQEVERKARADATTKRANMFTLMQEYRQAGVTPPFVNEDGTPSCSLALLLQLGWSIERIGDTVVTLMRPQRLAYDRPDRRPEPAPEATPDQEASS